GKRFYVVCNIAPHNAKVKTFMADMEPVIALGPDALIMSDPGLILLVRERWPEVPIHLSVQANVVNYAAVRFWLSMGVQRIILSRERSIEEIAETRALVPASRPWACSSIGSLYSTSTSCTEMTARSGTLVNSAILRRSPSGSGCSERHSSTSGWMPIERSSL